MVEAMLTHTVATTDAKTTDGDSGGTAEIETIYITSDTEEEEEAEAVTATPRGSRKRQRDVRRNRQGHYGANDTELYNFLSQQIPQTPGVQWYDPLFTKMKAHKALNRKGQLLITYNRARGSHWMAACFDHDKLIYGTMGTRDLSRPVTEYLESVHINIKEYCDITPAVGSQVESECGARAVVYCKWFATVRDRSSTDRRDMDIAQFKADVADCMAMWRAAR